MLVNPKYIVQERHRPLARTVTCKSRDLAGIWSLRTLNFPTSDQAMVWGCGPGVGHGIFCHLGPKTRRFPARTIRTCAEAQESQWMSNWMDGRASSAGWSVWLETDVSVVEELLGQTTNNLRDAAQLGQPSWSNSKLTNVLNRMNNGFDNVVDNWGRYVPNHVRIGASNPATQPVVGRPSWKAWTQAYVNCVDAEETTWWPAGTRFGMPVGGSIPVLRRPLQRQLVGIPERRHLRRWMETWRVEVRQPRACLRTGLGGERWILLGMNAEIDRLAAPFLAHEANSALTSLGRR